MEEHHKSFIFENFVSLIHATRANAELLSHLQSSKILCDEDVEEIVSSVKMHITY